MHWILLAIVAVLLIAMAGRFPKVAFSLLAVLIAVATALYQLVGDQEGSLEQMQVADVSLSEVRLKSYYADGFKATGKIHNHSEHHDLTEVVIQFTVMDCQDAASTAQPDCESLLSMEKQIRVHVPFGESQPFETTLQPGELKFSGQRRWKFKVARVTGRTPLR